MKLDSATAAVLLAPYRTGWCKRELITKTMNKMLKIKFLLTRVSDWSSPEVVVPKNIRKPRFCVDYRRLNTATKKDKHRIPKMDDCLDSLCKAQFFSTLYCTAGYWQVPLRKQGREKTAFVAHDGLFELRMTPGGLIYVPGIFERALHVIMSEWK